MVKETKLVLMVSNREFDTILAALRAWQEGQKLFLSNNALRDIATGGGKVHPLSGEEIDDLAGRINFEEGAFYVVVRVERGVPVAAAVFGGDKSDVMSAMELARATAQERDFNPNDDAVQVFAVNAFGDLAASRPLISDRQVQLWIDQENGVAKQGREARSRRANVKDKRRG